MALWEVACSHHELLFLRLLSLIGCTSFSLFQAFPLLGSSRERSPRCSAAPTAVATSRSAPQQTLGTGKPWRVNVWVWNRGEQANRLLMASCSSRLFFCSGGPSDAAADRRNRTMKPGTRACWITWFYAKTRTFSCCVLLLLSKLLSQSWNVCLQRLHQTLALFYIFARFLKEQDQHL